MWAGFFLLLLLLLLLFYWEWLDGLNGWQFCDRLIGDYIIFYIHHIGGYYSLLSWSLSLWRHQKLKTTHIYHMILNNNNNKNNNTHCRVALTPCNNDFSIWHHSIEPLNTHDTKEEEYYDHQNRLAMQWWQQHKKNPNNKIAK